mmetsp:Transcript_8017/g.18790  ORF Transcript_8017/g.18790 Transcript_8017/m.18790 type:complete len:234 (+) Transcript_8017:1225-1926(+)
MGAPTEEGAREAGVEPVGKRALGEMALDAQSKPPIHGVADGLVHPITERFEAAILIGDGGNPSAQRLGRTVRQRVHHLAAHGLGANHTVEHAVESAQLRAVERCGKGTKHEPALDEKMAPRIERLEAAMVARHDQKLASHHRHGLLSPPRRAAPPEERLVLVATRQARERNARQMGVVDSPLPRAQPPSLRAVEQMIERGLLLDEHDKVLAPRVPAAHERLLPPVRHRALERV